MAKSTLTTINQIMSIASKAHYLNGGNANKVLAKDKKGIFTVEQVADTLQCDPVELKQVLQQNQIMCGDYVIDEAWGDGEKLSTFALRTLNDKLASKPSIFSCLVPKMPAGNQPKYMSNIRANIITLCVLALIPLFIFDHPLIAILDLLFMIGLLIKPVIKQLKGEYHE